MWGAVFGLALMGALNPVRLSAILLVVSRPRPLRNLVVFWVGATTAAVALVLVPLLVLHDVSRVQSFVQAAGASPAARYVKLCAGLLLLTAAAVLLIGIVRRSAAPVREPARITTGPPAGERDSPPTAPDTDGGPTIRRLLNRTQEAWNRGALWMALVIGFLSAPAPDVVLLVLAVVLTSGASMVVQLSAGITYIVAMLVVVEVVMVSYAVHPAGTEVVLNRVRDATLRHRRQIVTAVLAMVGVGLTATGLGIA